MLKHLNKSDIFTTETSNSTIMKNMYYKVNIIILILRKKYLYFN